jgi:uncharacterized surface protein with fasciclin (FAS1) repeats
MPLTRTLAAFAAGTALVAGSLLATAPAASADSPTSGQQVSTLLGLENGGTNDGNPYDFDIVTTAIKATGLIPTVESLTDFTVFAPNDRAFEVLAVKTGAFPKNHKFGATVDEAAIVNALVTKLGIDTIRNVVLYHVFTGGAVNGAAATALPVFGTKLTMADGQKLGITNLTRFFGAPTLILGDKDGNFFNDYVVRSKVDVINIPGAAVHGISDVLLPKL